MYSFQTHCRVSTLLLLFVSIHLCLALKVSQNNGNNNNNKYNNGSNNNKAVPIDVTVDILIAGGSLSASAAALSLGNLTLQLNRPLQIALVEPTDWAGGQLSSSSVPPDFGKENSVPANLPASFVDLLLSVAGPTWSTNPGKCWVSYKCFETQKAADFLKQRLGQYANIHVYYNTVVKSSVRDSSGRNIAEVIAVQRTAKEGTSGYESNYSEDVQDWYSSIDSAKFSKQVIRFMAPKVVIEATEYADILMADSRSQSAGYPGVSQGVEYPEETSDTTDTSCGQSTVFPFHLAYDLNSNTSLEDLMSTSDVPMGDIHGYPMSLGSLTWGQAWTYRRVRGVKDYDSQKVYSGEISNQNLNNDYNAGYLFLPLDKMPDVANGKGWYGGLNLTTLKYAEERAYAWYHYLVDTSSGYNLTATSLTLDRTPVGTKHGLAKVPYLRDTRRAKRGINNFRLLYTDLNYSNPEDQGATARHFPDTVGIGVYLYADIHGLATGVCRQPYPEYVSQSSHPVKPFYLPFRALTSSDLDNVLVAGKCMAQSFMANAATRLHPVEYVSGVAAGAAAFLMVDRKWATTETMYQNVGELQALLKSETVQSPLTWTLPV